MIKDINKFRKEFKSKVKVDYHKFAKDEKGRLDVHKLVLNSVKNVPLFLDK